MPNYAPEMVQDLRGKVKTLATNHKWVEVAWQQDIGMVSYKKFIEGGQARINVYLTTMTVATALNHPRDGKNQMYRRGVSLKVLNKIFENPRLHTKRMGMPGYRSRKEIE